ncbi:MAG: hypothetical protein ACP6IP_03625 [Candidatus Njordarchaeia archaeon]
MSNEEECDCPMAKILKLLSRGDARRVISDEEFYEIIKKVLGLDDKDILREKPKKRKI